MGTIVPFWKTFTQAAGRQWPRTLVGVVTGVYGFVSFVEGLAQEYGLQALVPTWPKVAYTGGSVVLLLLFWFGKYAHQLRLKSIPKLELVKVIEEKTRRGEVTDQEFFLVVTNTGESPLFECLVKVDQIDGPATSKPHTPTALRTRAQRADNRTGPFTLRSGETKDVYFCSARTSPDNSFIIVTIEFESSEEWVDPDDQREVVIGLYSEGRPNRVRLRFERGTRGLLMIANKGAA